MEIAITHLGGMPQLLPATSVIKGIKKQKISTNITWVVGPDELRYINRYNKDIRRTISYHKLINEKKKYDLLINLYPIFIDNSHIDNIAKDATGFCFCKEYKKFEGAFLTDEKFPMSILQLYFILCGLRWHGEGYDIRYYPKTRTKRNRVGISVANANLRNYVLDNLELENMKVWYIPYKKNIFKKMDEINKCKKIITDDLTTFHLSMAMRKYVYYLNTFPLTMKLELFNNGQIIKVPTSIFQ